MYSLSNLRINIDFKWLLFSTFYGVLLAKNHNGTTNRTTPFDLLFNHLMDGYTPMQPHAPLTVEFAFYLHSIVNVDGHTGELTLFGYLAHSWNDSRLVWNPDEFGGIEVVNMGTEHIWVPHLEVINNMDYSMGDTIANKKSYPVTAFPNGLVFWGYASMISSNCGLNMVNFPFDYQVCVLQYGSVTSSDKLLELKLRPDGSQIILEKGFYKDNGEFKLEEHESRSGKLNECKSPIDGHNVTYPFIKISLEFSRRSEFYILTIMLPCQLLSFIGILAFTLPKVRSFLER